MKSPWREIQILLKVHQRPRAMVISDQSHWDEFQRFLWNNWNRNPTSAVRELELRNPHQYVKSFQMRPRMSFLSCPFALNKLMMPMTFKGQRGNPPSYIRSICHFGRVFSRFTSSSWTKPLLFDALWSSRHVGAHLKTLGYFYEVLRLDFITIRSKVSRTP